MTGIREVTAFAAIALGVLTLPSTASAQENGDPLAPVAGPADPATAAPPALSSEEAAQLTNWVIRSGDNGGRAFIVIDKVAARVLVFDSGGKLVGSAPALLGVSKGDESAPGVGDRELRNIPVKDRTTPAGRYAAKFGPAAGHSSVLWVDYTTALSLHAVVQGTKKERRLQRLNSKTSKDNRITFGCINVPTKFYSGVVKPLFEEDGGIVYILPETKPLKDVFLALQ